METPKVIGDAYTDKLPDSYFVRFGNRLFGYQYADKSSFLADYKTLLRDSIHSGDMTVFYNGVAIRSVCNMNERVLNTGAKYKCFVIKYKWS